jgi:hypothetical protein
LPNDSEIPNSSDVFNGDDVFLGCQNLNGLETKFFRRFFCCEGKFKDSFTVKEFWNVIIDNAKIVENKNFNSSD